MDDSYHDFWAFDRPHVRKPPRPFLSRLVALGAAGLLLVPIGLVLRQGDGPAVEAGSLPGAAVNLEASSREATSTAGLDASASTTVPATEESAATAATEDTGTTAVAAGDTAGTLPAAAGTLPQALGTLPATVPTTAAPTPAPTAAPRAEAVVTAAAATQAPATTRAPATTKAPAAAPRPTPAPTTAAPRTTTTVARPPANTWPSSAVESIIREVWPDDLEQRALEIAYRESRLVPTAHNGWCCYGLFQIYWDVHKSWISALGHDLEDLYDPRVNAQLAYLIYQRAGGWGPWE